jgi:hypothetical protein
MEQVRSTLVQALCESWTELFDGQNMSLSDDTSELSPGDETPRISSCISFVSENVKGGLALHLPIEVLQKSHPTNPGKASESELTDWSGELANQLVGRLKNKLLRYSLTLMVGIPAIMKRVNKKVLCTRAAVGSWHRFDCGEHPCHLKFESVIEPGIELKMAADDEMPADEGETMLF